MLAISFMLFWMILFWILEKLFDLELIHPNDHPALQFPYSTIRFVVTLQNRI